MARSPDVAPTPTAVNCSKNVISLAAFAAIAVALGERWPALERWPFLLASGAVGFALGDALYFAAVERIGVQKSAMLAEINVPLTALSSYFAYGERFSPWTLAAI